MLTLQNRKSTLTWIYLGILATNVMAQNVRIATFNTSLFREKKGLLLKELKTGKSDQAKKIAQIIQIVQPQIILLNEFDFDADSAGIEQFQKRFLSKSQGANTPITYKYVFAPSVNTGLPSGLDLDNDGQTNGPGDNFGYGQYEGQYGFVVLSQFPIDHEASRTFQKFLWKDMPDALLPENEDGSSYYSTAELNAFRLSSKNHCDVVIKVGGKNLHFLVSHPTPPVFDGAEDRNGRRNHDEIRFWNDYVDSRKGRYIYDDRNGKGGLDAEAFFIIAGDLNADPFDGDSTNNPIGLLKKNRRINFDLQPQSDGADDAAKHGAANAKNQGDPRLDTADFDDNKVGNLRIDYVLPSKNLKVKSSGVFWPKSSSNESKLLKASDHRLVWVDLDWD